MYMCNMYYMHTGRTASFMLDHSCKSRQNPVIVAEASQYARSLTTILRP